LLTLFPQPHLEVREIEGDGRDCCGAISLEGAGECSVDVARARLLDRRSCAPAEEVEGVKLTAAAAILRLRSLEGAQAHKNEGTAGSSRITSVDAATTLTRVLTGLSRAPPTAALVQPLKFKFRKFKSSPQNNKKNALHITTDAAFWRWAECDPGYEAKRSFIDFQMVA
jgi:hypothetical protein